MPVSFSIPNTLSKLATALKTNPGNANQSVYLSFDSNGNFQTASVERPTVTNNCGYSFEYPDGSVIYTLPVITSAANVPWSNSFSGDMASNVDKLVLWIDAKESKSINSTQQKIMSKYTNYMTVENTPNYSFTYANETIDLSSLGGLASVDNITFKNYFKLGIVFDLKASNLISPTNHGLTNNTIFQHDLMEIRYTNQATPAGPTTSMIGFFYNNNFVSGVTLNPNAGVTRYMAFVDQSGIIQVNNVQSAMTNTYSFVSPTSNLKLYIGQDSAGGKNSAIKLYELIYYSHTTSIGITNGTITNYLINRWSVPSYVDSFNLYPNLNSWDNQKYGYGDRRSLITVFNTGFNWIIGTGGGFPYLLDGLSHQNSNPYLASGQTIDNTKFFGFDFGTAVKVSGIKWMLSGYDNVSKIFDIQATNTYHPTDGWTTLKSNCQFGLSTGVSVSSGQLIPDYQLYIATGTGGCYVYTHTFENSIGYRYYRLLGVSGSTSGGPYDLEFTFRISTPLPATPYTNSILNSDTSTAFHYDMSIVSYTGSSITAINDQATKGNNAAYITLFNKSASTLNSKYYGNFSSVSNYNYFQSPAAGTPSSGASFMFFMLARYNTDDYSNIITMVFDNYFNGNGANLQFIFPGGVNPPSSLRISTSSSLVGNLTFTNNWVLISVTFDSSNSTARLYYKGDLLATGTIGASWTKNPLIYGMQVYLDASGNPYGANTNLRMKGDIAEIVMYHGYDNNTRQKIEGLLASNWGLENLAISSNHLYYGTRPSA